MKDDEKNSMIRINSMRFLEQIKAAASRYRIPLDIAIALVETESTGNEWAYRYEPQYPYLEAPEIYAARRGISRASETALQMSSFGLTQVMGGVAREHSFQGDLPELFKPEVSLEYGFRHLRNKADRYGDEPGTLYAAYNAGSVRRTSGGMFINQKHVDRFYRILLDVQTVLKMR